MGHGDDDARAFKNQRNGLIGDAERLKGRIDEAVILQNDKPRRSADKQRGPKRQQHCSQQHIAQPAAGGGNDHGKGQPDHQTGQHHRQANDEGPRQNGLVGRCILRQGDNLVMLVPTIIERCEQVAIGIGRRRLSNGVPPCHLIPALVDIAQIDRAITLLDHPARLAHQGPEAGFGAIEATHDCAHFLTICRGANIGHQCILQGSRNRRLSIPF